MTLHADNSELLGRLTRALFQQNPGDLPEIMISPLCPDVLRAGFEFLFQHGAHLVGKPSLYDPAKKKEILLHRLSDPVGMVIAGIARPFHFLIRNFRMLSTVLPEIGVLILPDGIALDYMQGEEWQKPQVSAFFTLLGRLAGNGPEVGLRLEQHIPDNFRVDLIEAVAKINSDTSQFPRQD